MPLGDLTEALRLAEFWTGGLITTVTQKGSTVSLSDGGEPRTLSMEDLRNKLNAQAVCLTPKRYPVDAPNGKPYPQTVPSKWATVRQEGNDAVISGRGWGHGVGMVQWGLKGKAERGMTYAQMLSFYYGGLKPVKRSEPDKIRVGLAVNLEEITIERLGDVRVDGASFPDGPVRITGGQALTVAPGDPIAQRLRLEKLIVTPPPGPGLPATVNFELSAPAKVHLEFSGPAAPPPTPEEPRESGLQAYSWSPATAGLPLADYQLTVVASDGVDTVRSQPLDLLLATPSPSPSVTPAPSPRATPSPSKDSGSAGLNWPLIGAAAALLILAATTAIVLALRRTPG
jgi:hypothetical protein